MSYTVLVFVKQVPDTQNITGDAMKADGTVNRAALPAIFNPEDLNALEMALDLKDRYGVKVVVATLGPPAAAEVLRQSLYRGADEAILLLAVDVIPKYIPTAHSYLQITITDAINIHPLSIKSNQIGIFLPF